MRHGLYIVPTPIGNLSDMTERAVAVLRQVDLIASEDTRHSRRLLDHFAIETPLKAYHEHVSEQATQALVAQLKAGATIALISDAGTPLVSDPGYRLVRAVQDAAIPVIPLPGPCAAITALSASGLPTHRFAFEGFLPAKGAQRKAQLSSLANTDATLIFYEAPHRILETLTDACECFGSEREAAIARELTKTFETVRRGPLGTLREWVAADSDQRRGELVFMVAPSASPQSALEVQADAILTRLAQDLPPRKAAAITADLTGLKARTLYQQLLDDRGE